MNKREIAEKLYAEKKRTGANITPIGRKTPLTKQEFVKRYINGVGGLKGFKKDELQGLLDRESKKPSKTTTNKAKPQNTALKAPRKPATAKSSNLSRTSYSAQPRKANSGRNCNKRRK